MNTSVSFERVCWIGNASRVRWMGWQAVVGHKYSPFAYSALSYRRHLSRRERRPRSERARDTRIKTMLARNIHLAVVMTAVNLFAFQIMANFDDARVRRTASEWTMMEDLPTIGSTSTIDKESSPLRPSVKTSDARPHSHRHCAGPLGSGCVAG